MLLVRSEEVAAELGRIAPHEARFPSDVFFPTPHDIKVLRFGKCSGSSKSRLATLVMVLANQSALGLGFPGCLVQNSMIQTSYSGHVAVDDCPLRAWSPVVKHPKALPKHLRHEPRTEEGLVGEGLGQATQATWLTNQSKRLYM